MNARRRMTLLLSVWVLFISLFAYISHHYPYFSPKWINTRTSPNYSETAFRSLTLGTTTSEVNAKLGLPIRAIPAQDGDVETWAYTVVGKVSRLGRHLVASLITHLEWRGDQEALGMVA